MADTPDSDTIKKAFAGFNEAIENLDKIPELKAHVDKIKAMVKDSDEAGLKAYIDQIKQNGL